MARMPDRTKLGYAIPRPATGIIPGPGDAVARAVQGAGQDLARVGNFLQVNADEEKRKTDTTELARARALWTEGLVKEDASYRLNGRPNYNQWGEEFGKFSTGLESKALSMISDPHLKEKFRQEARVDKAQYGTKIGARSYKIGVAARKTNMDLALDGQLRAASAPSANPAESGEILKGIGVSLRRSAETGLYTPAEATLKHQAIQTAFATAKATQHRDENPERSHYWLTKGADESLLLAKMERRESGDKGMDAKHAGGAVGAFGFMPDTWAGLIKTKPGLGLTKEGIRSYSQQKKAARAILQDYKKTLKRNGLPRTEANAYSLHFMGEPKGAKLLKADGSKDAAKMFPASAADNPDVFYDKQGKPRTVAQVRNILAKGFAGDYGEAPAYYKHLPTNTHLTLTGQSRAAAIKQFGEGEKQRVLSQAFATAGEAHALPDPSEGDSLVAGIRDAEVRAKAQSQLEYLRARDEKQRERTQAETYRAGYDAVREAMERGDVEAAKMAIPDDLDAESKARLEKIIASGAEVYDEAERQETIDHFNELALNDREAFLSLDDTSWFAMAGTISQGDIDALKAKQQALIKAGEGSTAAYAMANSIAKGWFKEIGVKTTPKASKTDARNARIINSEITRVTDRLVKQLGRDPRKEELEAAIAPIFLQTKSTRWTGDDYLAIDEYIEETFDNYTTAGADINLAIAQLRDANLSVNTASLKEWLALWQKEQ